MSAGMPSDASATDAAASVAAFATVTSADGTPIAFERTGTGPVLVLVGGAFSYRRFPLTLELVALLAERFTVVNYDRRGRGDSGDISPYAVEREVEDLAAVIAATAGPDGAFVWGLSSGAALALEGASAGLPISRLALYDPPFQSDPAPKHPRPAVEAEVRDRLARGDRNGAVRVFLVNGMGMPAFIAPVMRLTPPWKRLTALAHTIPYDLAVTAPDLSGRDPLPAHWENASMPVTVMVGEKSPATLIRAAEIVATVLPQAALQRLPGQNHVFKPAALAPALIELFLD